MRVRLSIGDRERENERKIVWDRERVREKRRARETERGRERGCKAASWENKTHMVSLSPV